MGFFRSPTGERRGSRHRRGSISSSLTPKTLDMLPRSVVNYRELKHQTDDHTDPPVLETESSSNTEPATSGSSSEEGSNSNRGTGRSDNHTVDDSGRGRSTMSTTPRSIHSSSHHHYHSDSNGRRRSSSRKASSSVSRTTSRSRSTKSTKSTKSRSGSVSRRATSLAGSNLIGCDEEGDARIQLDSDMAVLADGLHLDNNTKTLLAAYDATTVENFFLMGENDFNHLLARARASNRSLPPLQVRKVQILRQWVANMIDETDISKLPLWAQSDALSAHRTGRDGKNQSLVPHDWQKRYNRDLPMLKKKVRERGDSLIEIFPVLSYFYTVRDTVRGTVCGTVCGAYGR
jgi:hypothetical protein